MKQNPFKKCGGDSQGGGLQLDQEPLRTDVCTTWFSAVAFPCVKPLLNNRQRQKRPHWGYKDKRTGLLRSGPKFIFSDESKFWHSFGIRVPESGGR